MNQIKCPKCHEVFKLDEASADSIKNQIKNAEFEKELKDRLDLAVGLSKSEFEIKFAQMRANFTEHLGEVKKALNDEIVRKDNAITQLKNENETAQLKKAIELKNTVEQIEKERDSLKSSLSLKQTEFLLSESKQKQVFDIELKRKDDEIAYYKELKSRQNSKLLGESLEQHCEIAFERMRAAAFKNAQFGKDNIVKDGGKGDYIYREFDTDGVEIVSIMFDMKTEQDYTATKTKNDDFLDKLDKDRRAKLCEYAVLVSTLEKDNDLYNDGIVDVSHRHKKMYIVRPNSFIAIISLIRNFALETIGAKSELVKLKNQNIDITNFEEKLTGWVEYINDNVRYATEDHSKAIEMLEKQKEGIDKIIKLLQNSSRYLKLSDKKTEELTIKKLTYGNKTMKAEFEKQKKSGLDD